MKVVLAGATGLIGRSLAGELQQAGHEVVALTRRPGRAGGVLPPGVSQVAWDARTAEGAWTAELAGAQAVVNLAGANIGTRPWTAGRKRELRQSRLDATRALLAALEATPAGRRPGALVNASGIDYYGHRLEGVLDEDSPPGDSFLARLCVEWEAAAPAERLGVRVVLMRTALVVAPNALAFRLLALPFRLFAGGPLGDGRQWFTWIHLDDVAGLYRFAVEREDVAGPLNAVAPDVRPQREVAREIARVLGRPSWLPAPSLALRLLLRDQADLLLHGRRAEPRRALAYGYTFRRPDLHEALVHTLRPSQAERPTTAAA